jgi:hypothetical protein
VSEFLRQGGEFDFGEHRALDSRKFPLTRCPLRLDFDRAFHSRSIVTETTPQPILRTLDQVSLDQVTVHVSQFLDSLVLAPNVEIIVPREPEGAALGRMKQVRRILLEHLQRSRERAAFRFAEQQVNVFGHDHIAGDKKSVPLADSLEGLLEDIAGVRVRQQRLAIMTAEGYEVQTFGLLNALESPWHAAIVDQVAR